MGRAGYKLHEDVVSSGDQIIHYRYYLSRKRRTLGMSVQPDGRVVVRSPVGVPLQAIREFVLRHRDWIVKAQRQLTQRASQPKRSFAQGSVHLFLGREYRLCIEEGQGPQVHIRGQEIVVTAPAAKRNVPAILKEWYSSQARQIFGERLVECHSRLEDIPLPAGLTIRSMASRWGSYSYRTRRVCLNLQLIRLPLHCLDYVIIHELCHARVRHHGPEFWRLVGRFVPDHLKVRKELRRWVDENTKHDEEGLDNI